MNSYLTLNASQSFSNVSHKTSMSIHEAIYKRTFFLFKLSLFSKVLLIENRKKVGAAESKEEQTDCEFSFDEALN